MSEKVFLSEESYSYTENLIDNLSRTLKEIYSAQLCIKLEYVFNWDEIPERDNGRLVEFLIKKLGIDWAITAKIEKIDNGKAIRVFTEKNSLIMKLNDKKTEVVLEIDYVRTNKFVAKIEKDELNIYKLENEKRMSNESYKRRKMAELKNILLKLGAELVMNMSVEVAKYKDFELEVGSDGRIRASSESGDYNGELKLNRDEISLALGLIEKGETDKKFLKNVGNKLFHSLFPEDIRVGLQATISSAESQGYSVRLRLVFNNPDLAALPWEFIYDDSTNVFLANDTQTALSRYIDVPSKKRDISASLPLKMLLIVSGPKDLPTLDASGEEQLIKKALENHVAEGQVEIDILQQPTILNVNQKLEEISYDIIHFVGHGVFDNGQGFIALTDDNGNSLLLDDDRFSHLFLSQKSIGLVVLNACQGATLSSSHAFAGMAPHLVQRGIPAVIAMQYPILDSTAKLFADKFYRTLALGLPVDEAIQSTRNLISIQVGLGKRDFATPVLYMRAKDGIIMSGL